MYKEDHLILIPAVLIFPLVGISWAQIARIIKINICTPKYEVQNVIPEVPIQFNRQNIVIINTKNIESC